eukprot:10604007-Alexandrium_andersonii.AAC.1
MAPPGRPSRYFWVTEQQAAGKTSRATLDRSTLRAALPERRYSVFQHRQTEAPSAIADFEHHSQGRGSSCPCGSPLWASH